MRAVRLVVAFGLTGCFWPGVSQQTGPDTPKQNTPDPAVYEPFFAQVAQLTQSITVSGPTLVNGQQSTATLNGVVIWTPTLAQPKAQDAIGLTDQESLALNDAASDCQAKLDALNPAMEHLIFEARLERIRTEGTPAWLMQRMGDLESQRTQIVLDHIQKLKAAFGGARFEMLDSWVHSKKEAASFFSAGSNKTDADPLTKRTKLFRPEAVPARPRRDL